MSSSYDISTTFDPLDDSLVSDVFDLDSWCSSFTPPVPGDEPVRHATPRPRQKRYPRTRRHPRPTPAVMLPSVHAVSPLPVLLFVPLVAGTELHYQLTGRRTLTDSHPLGGYRCFRCNSLGHWSSDHDRTRGRVYGGPPHSGVLPGAAR